MFPSVRQGPVVAALYTARAYAREAELALYLGVPGDADERADLEAGDEPPVDRALPHDGQVRRRHATPASTCAPAR